MALNKRLTGASLLGVAIATFIGAIITQLIWDAREVLLAAIAIEAVALVGLLILLFWPDPDFETGDVNPELVRCPRCESVFDPPKRGETIKCPTCGLQANAPKRTAPENDVPTERPKDDVLS